VGIWNRGSAPHCDCGGIIGAFPVFNHIGLFEKDVQKARTWISQAELVLIIGAQGNYSGVWYSYIRSSAKIVQINPKSTQFDKIAVLSIHQAADEIFSQLS